MKEITVTTFTDPMMGLTYEMEPVYEKLQQNFPGIQFRWVMSLLVKDVSQFMLPGETIPEYNRRLAKIYESEEAVGGLPIHMPDFCLFDEDHRSSLPLNLAYKAAQLADSDKADQFLWNLRHATIVDVLPTAHYNEILKVVHKTGINEKDFARCYKNGSAAKELEKDLALGERLHIQTLPAFLISTKETSVLIRRLLRYEDFEDIITELSASDIHKQSSGRFR